MTSLPTSKGVKRSALRESCSKIPRRLCNNSRNFYNRDSSWPGTPPILGNRLTELFIHRTATLVFPKQQTILRDLGDGLILRRSTPEDANSLAEFNHAIHADNE